MNTKKTFKFSNGDKVKEKITGFEGVITGTCFYITGCDQYLVVPKSKKPNVKSEGAWYDEGRLDLVEENVLDTNKVASKSGTGSDVAAPNKG